VNEGLVSKLLSLDELFKGRHFDAEIIVLCVRWYLGYNPSYRDLAEHHSALAPALRSGVREALESRFEVETLPFGDEQVFCEVQRADLISGFRVYRVLDCVRIAF
jgi:hypothetical protein